MRNFPDFPLELVGLCARWACSPPPTAVRQVRLQEAATVVFLHCSFPRLLPPPLECQPPSGGHIAITVTAASQGPGPGWHPIDKCKPHSCPVKTGQGIEWALPRIPHLWEGLMRMLRSLVGTVMGKQEQDSVCLAVPFCEQRLHLPSILGEVFWIDRA